MLRKASGSVDDCWDERRQAVDAALGSHPILDRIVKRERRRPRHEAARDEEENAGDQRHLHARNRDDVKDARFADEVLGVVGEEVALPWVSLGIAGYWQDVETTGILPG